MMYEERLNYLQATADGGCSVFVRFQNMTQERGGNKSFQGP